ncbi:hypothetical protein [Solimonas soli]|uniref:hypothetical protein n=1 Tax=Solimonas soli TaxID=413479 RepID=UPI0012FB7033|nr:hypothetical protein [Solimonas soli]
MSPRSISKPAPPEVRRGGSRHWLAPLLMVFASAAAIAAEGVPELTRASLQLLAAAPAGDSAAVLYVGAAAEAPLLRDLRVQVDDRSVIRYQFSEDEARALVAGGLKRVLPLPPGEHRLRGEIVARAATGKPGATRYSASFDQTVTVAAQSYQLIFDDGGMLSAARADLQPATPAAPQHEADYLLATGRAVEAAVLLESSARDPQRLDAAYRALGLAAPAPGEAPTALVAYNQALGAGDVAALAALGSADAGAGADALALRDLANVSAGYRELSAGRGEAAMPYFRLVRSPGPYSSAAMLGLGWCYLWPSNANAAAREVSLRPNGADAIAATRRQTPFRYLQAIASGARAEDLRRALIPWAELLGRDPLDPAVQEGLLAIPYALDHFGAHEQARRYYERALATFDTAHGMLAAARREISGGQVLAALDARDADVSSGWPRLLVEQRDDALAVPLRMLVADAAVTEPLREYRQLRTLDRLLAARGEAGDTSASPGALRGRIAAASAAAAARLQSAMFGVLQKLEQQTTRYQAEAEFAMARIYDRDPHGVAQQ